MALKKKPVNGMKDILPYEMQIRDYVTKQIKEIYGKFGFSSLETPCVEHIENLTSKQGGDNEKLIFKILKRGEKLNVKDAVEEMDVVSGGLRYDLTVPLCRYYSNNANQLPNPFKALQMGSVWRADKPQKGRYRQFVQCDIDILGDSSYLAEIELILATTTLLGNIGFQGYKVRINDRRILKGMAAYSGFSEDNFDRVFIILDKMDKIGLEGVAAELLQSGFEKENIDTYLDLFKKVTGDLEGIRFCRDILKEVLPSEVLSDLENIIKSVERASSASFELIFDPALVRGMSYYTGTIFEIEMEGFSGSVAGGGRYDDMIGKFTGMQTPACGFSIGFERIITILMENGFTVPQMNPKKVYLLEKGLNSDRVCDVIMEAAEERKAGVQVLVTQMNKNKKFQKEQLVKDGYEEFKEFYKEQLKK